MRVSRPGGARIETLSVRFCLAPTSSSPSTSSTGRSPRFLNSNSGTLPPSETSPTRAVPDTSASSRVTYVREPASDFLFSNGNIAHPPMDDRRPDLEARNGVLDDLHGHTLLLPRSERRGTLQRNRAVCQNLSVAEGGAPRSYRITVADDDARRWVHRARSTKKW